MDKCSSSEDSPVGRREPMTSNDDKKNTTSNLEEILVKEEPPHSELDNVDGPEEDDASLSAASVDDPQMGVELEARAAGSGTRLPRNKLTCTLCPKSFNTKKKLFYHQMKCTGILVPKHGCSRCGKSCSTKQMLRRHQVRCPKIIPAILPCTRCGQSFSGKTHLFRHQLHCTGISCYVCSFCGKQSSEKQSHKTHILVRHPLEFYKGELPPSCTKQQFQDATRIVLNEHVILQNSEGRKVFGCPKCSSSHVSLRSLRSHIIRSHIQDIVLKLDELQPGKRAPVRRESRATTTTAPDAALNSADSEDLEREAAKLLETNETRYGRLVRNPSGTWHSDETSIENSKKMSNPKQEKRFKCEICDFASHHITPYEIHMRRKHAAFTLADKLPPGTTEEQLQSALGPVTKDICWICKRKSKLFKDRPSVRDHILAEHLSQISQILCEQKKGEEGMPSFEVVAAKDQIDPSDEVVCKLEIGM